MAIVDVSESSFFDVNLAVLLSLLAWPIVYLVETFSIILHLMRSKCSTHIHCHNVVHCIRLITNGYVYMTLECGMWIVEEFKKRPVTMMSLAFIMMTSIMIVLRIFSTKKSWISHVFGLFTLTCMIDLIFTLELWGCVSGFVTQYRSLGEPYLSSAWGCAILLFDGTFIYIQYLIMIHLISNNKSWRNVGIYWVSGIINSMIVLLSGIASGKHKPTFCTFINVPYASVPIYCAIRLFYKEKDVSWSVQSIRSSGMFYNVAVVTGLLYAIWISFSKGMLSIGSQSEIFQYIISHERALLDDSSAPFAKIQSLVYLFYAAPIMIVSIVYIFRKKKPQIVWELALINGGLMLQAQFSFIAAALDFQTPIQLRSDPTDWIFWMNNLVLLIAPQLFIWSLYKSNVSDCREIKKIISATMPFDPTEIEVLTR